MAYYLPFLRAERKRLLYVKSGSEYIVRTKTMVEYGRQLSVGGHPSEEKRARGNLPTHDKF